MSWFDSGFTLAKTAFSQAQKSIDRALEIDAREAAGTEQQEHPCVLETSKATHTSLISSNTTPTNALQKPEKEKNVTMSSKTSKNVTSSTVLGSTWGGMDSYWNSSLTSETKGVNELNKTTSDSTDISPEKTMTKTVWSSKYNEFTLSGQHSSSNLSSTAGERTRGGMVSPVLCGEEAENMSGMDGNTRRAPAMTSTPVTSSNISKERLPMPMTTLSRCKTNSHSLPLLSATGSLSPLPPSSKTSSHKDMCSEEDNRVSSSNTVSPLSNSNLLLLTDKSSSYLQDSPTCNHARISEEQPIEEINTSRISAGGTENQVRSDWKEMEKATAMILTSNTEECTLKKEYEVKEESLSNAHVRLEEKSVGVEVKNFQSTGRGQVDEVKITRDGTDVVQITESGDGEVPATGSGADAATGDEKQVSGTVIGTGDEADEKLISVDGIGGIQFTGGDDEVSITGSAVDEVPVTGGGGGVESPNSNVDADIIGQTHQHVNSSPITVSGSDLVDSPSLIPREGCATSAEPLEKSDFASDSVLPCTKVVGTKHSSHKERTVGTDEERGREEESVEQGDVEGAGLEMAHSTQLEKLREELHQVHHVLEARETKVMSMSEEMVALMEGNQTLQGELAAAREMSSSSMEEMRDEFTKRISTSQKKLQAVTKERDSLKKQLMAVQNEQSLIKRTEGEEVSKILKEKEQQIAQLMEEGEKLSKQELQSNSNIKKLRLKERQNDQLLVSQRQQIEDLESKIKNMKDLLKKKDENERKYQESILQLNTIAEQQAKELSQHKTEKEELTEKVRSLQFNLDNSYRELSDVQKTSAVSQTAAQEAASTAEKTKQEEIKLVLEKYSIAAQREKEALIMQIEELRMSVSRSEQQLAWKEDHMKQEVGDIRKRLQEADDRNQELTSTISQATKPLLRQIENLQSAHCTQSTNWENVESNLTQRLVDAQTQLNIVLDKERSASEREMAMRFKVNSLENQLNSIRQERSQLQATVELERAKIETMEEGQYRESAKLEAIRASYQRTMDEMRKEKEMTERQLEYERVRLEAESRKACLESQEKERLKSQLAHSLSRMISRQSSSLSQGDVLEKSGQDQGSEYVRGESVSSDVISLHDHSHSGLTIGSASVVEKLQSLLKQKEGELANMQSLVTPLERSRAAMAEDLATISAKNEQLSQEVECIPQLKEKLEEMRKKQEAILQMYGEKAEEAEELRLDIQDLKLMYRQQIDELLGGRQ